MEIIPVMDILNSVVVHAVRGERKNYEPVKSILCSSPNPLEVAASFKGLGLKKLYIADLDAILRKGSNYEIIRRISESTKLGVIVDAGISNMSSAEEIFKYKISELIIGTETLTSLGFVKKCLEKFGSERIILSLDMKNGKVLGSFQEATKDPLDVALIFEKMGVKKMIVLDLSKIGSEEGTNWSVLNKILETVGMEIIAGGGLRNFADLMELKKKGVYAALIATALHNGNIRKEDIKKIQRT